MILCIVAAATSHVAHCSAVKQAPAFVALARSCAMAIVSTPRPMQGTVVDVESLVALALCVMSAHVSRVARLVHHSVLPAVSIPKRTHCIVESVGMFAMI